MNYKYYERKINDVILKCPIEAGVEILTTISGISDMAILSNDFQYRTDIGEVYGFIEVKATSKPLVETMQVEGQNVKKLWVINIYLLMRTNLMN